MWIARRRWAVKKVGLPRSNEPRRAIAIDFFLKKEREPFVKAQRDTLSFIEAQRGSLKLKESHWKKQKIIKIKQSSLISYFFCFLFAHFGFLHIFFWFFFIIFVCFHCKVLLHPDCAPYFLSVHSTSFFLCRTGRGIEKKTQKKQKEQKKSNKARKSRIFFIFVAHWASLSPNEARCVSLRLNEWFALFFLKAQSGSFDFRVWKAAVQSGKGFLIFSWKAS